MAPHGGAAAGGVVFQPRQHEGYLLDGVIRFDKTHLEDPHSPGPRLRGFGASLYM